MSAQAAQGPFFKVKNVGSVLLFGGFAVLYWTGDPENLRRDGHKSFFYFHSAPPGALRDPDYLQ